MIRRFSTLGNPWFWMFMYASFRYYLASGRTMSEALIGLCVISVVVAVLVKLRYWVDDHARTF